MGSPSVSSKEVPAIDLEHLPPSDPFLNTALQTLTWEGVTVTVKDRETKKAKNIVDDVSGIVEAGTSPSLSSLPNPWLDAILTTHPLPFHRRDARHHGPVRVRQDNPAQLSRDAADGRRLQLRHGSPQRQSTQPNHAAVHLPLRRARRRADRLPDGARDHDVRGAARGDQHVQHGRGRGWQEGGGGAHGAHREADRRVWPARPV